MKHPYMTPIGRFLLASLLLLIAVVLVAIETPARAQTVVPSYQESATGSIKNGVGMTCLAGCTSAVGASAASIPINVSTAATTQLVALSSAKLIYVSHFDFIANGTTTVTLEYGTGALCATGTTVLTGPYNLTAQTGISAGNGGGVVLFVPASQALCIVNSAAVQVSGVVSYAQQ